MIETDQIGKFKTEPTLNEDIISSYLFNRRGHMKQLKKILVVLVLAILVAGYIKYQNRGPAEKAGAKLDNAMQDVSKKAKDLLGK
ncbi:MAG: hypothetical protein COV66_05590 [Nitrospinae bacterium CG11_big_fil_rev_8_21_14_0_20_45_15]|nr:MAG: hypothetical protein COV66_05590 [Nitrospinae bacterium CG11_big_fil_rev_8_21_14_0_20_45_15]